MAITDYNKKKKLDVDSVTGTPTVGKAQPVMITGETSYDLASASYTGTSLSTQDTVPRDIAFNNDGTKMFEVGSNSDLIYEYSLSTAYDISTATFSQSIATQDTSPASIAFNGDGTKMFELGFGSDLIYEYSLSTAYDISTASYTGTSLSTQDTSPKGMAFNDTGTKMYEVGNSGAKIYQYDLSTAYDIASASFQKSIATQDSFPVNMAFNGDGTKMFELGDNSDLIYEYSLSTAYDIASASYTGTSIATQDTDPGGIAFNGDGTKMFEVGYGSDLIYEYDSGTTESKTGNGDIVIDFTNVADAQDLAVYDQNGNLLDYEIEDLDTTAETATLWCYNSWVRDGTTQAQLAYGGNSANTDRQNATATWGNTGQNCVFVQHLEESASPFTDSTSNNNDSVTTVGTSDVDGQFGRGQQTDGTDDYMNFGDPASMEPTDQITAVMWFNTTQSATAYASIYRHNGHIIPLQLVDNGNARIVPFSGGFTNDPSYEFTWDTVYDDGNWHSYVGTRDSTNGTKAYVDTTQEVSTTVNTGSLDTTTDDWVLGANAASGSEYFAGKMDAVRLYTDDKSAVTGWIQAEQDASPKGGQVFFSQQAAESTLTKVSLTVSDSLGFTESSPATLQDSLTDSIGFTEGDGYTLNDSFSDTVTFSEALSIAVKLLLTDSLSLSEADSYTLNDTVSDSLVFTEQLYSELGFKVNDSLVFSESLGVAIPLNVSDQLGFTEGEGYTLNTVETDQLSLTESQASTLRDNLSDQLGFTEQTSQAIALQLSDQLGFTESEAFKVVATLQDSLTFNETTVFQGIINTTVSDSLGFTESTDSALNASLTDSLSLQESVNSTLEDVLTETITFTEVESATLQDVFTEQLGFNEELGTALAVTVADSLGLSEGISSTLADAFTDQLGFTESESGTLQATLVDALGFTEEFNSKLKAELVDQLGFTEVEASTLASTLTDQLSVTDQVTVAELLNISIDSPAKAVISNLSRNALIDNLNKNALITSMDKFVTMEGHTFKQNDLGDSLKAVLQDENGAIDISGAASVKVRMHDRSGTKVLDSKVNITDAANGKIKYDWSAGDPIETAGVYRAEFKIEDGTGKIETVPNDGYVVLEVEEELG